MKKKNQHYVFSAYLKPWTKNGKIYCLRDGRIFPSNLDGVACERFFYKLEELTPQEVELIEQAVIEPSAESTKAYLRKFIALCSLAPKMKKHFASDAKPMVTSTLDEVIINFGEDHHQRIENSLLRFLNLMLAGNTEFYSDNGQVDKFLYALSVQYTRTKQVREAMLSQIGTTFKGCDTRRIWSVLSHIMAMKIAESLYIDRQRFRLLLIDNDTDTPFITADQPIINLHDTSAGKPPDKLEYFYPLSPQKAMLLLETSSRISDQPVGAISVNGYNVRMIQNSHEQVFSNSEEYLASVSHLICGKAGDLRIKA